MTAAGSSSAAEHVFSRNSLKGKAKINALHDAFWKSGMGGFTHFVVPSLDLVITKWAAITDNTI